MQDIKVSVVVPIYNTEKFLRKCIESIVNQTLEEIEIILINDGSTDNSHIICEEYSRKYPKKIRYINNKNIGCSATRNLGISLARGEYIAFVDSDDYIEREMYQEMYEKAWKEDIDIVISGIRYHYFNKELLKIREIYPENTKNKIKLLDPKNKIANCYNKLFKRKMLKKYKIVFPENTHNSEDLVFCFEALCVANKIISIPKGYYNYVLHGNNSVFNLEKRVGVFFALKELFLYLEKNDYIKNKKIMDKFYKNFNLHGIKMPFFMLLNYKLVSKDKYKRYKKLFCEELKKLDFIPLKSKALIYFYRSILWIVRSFNLYYILKEIKNKIGEFYERK